MKKKGGMLPIKYVLSPTLPVNKKKEFIRSLFLRKPGIIDAHTHIGISLRNYAQGAYPYCMNFEDLIVRMDVLNIAYAIVFGFDSAYYAAQCKPTPKITLDRRVSRFPYEVENVNLLREIYVTFPEYAHRVVPFLLFDPEREAEKQVENIERLMKQYPVFGLKTIPFYIHSYIRGLENKGKPILNLMKKYGLPVTFHSSARKEVDPWSYVGDILSFAERNPEIRVCIAHTARFDRHAIDRAAKLSNVWIDLSAFIIHCELAVNKHMAVARECDIFKADYHNPIDVMKKLVESYSNLFIWGTDTPYYYFIQQNYTAQGKISGLALRCGYNEEVDLLNLLGLNLIKQISTINTVKYIFGK
ncbi:MAG: amidohydrolase family protein [Elusimicrobiota bacterium]